MKLSELAFYSMIIRCLDQKTINEYQAKKAIDFFVEKSEGLQQ